MLLVFIPIYILITLAIGFYASRRIKTSSDFTLAGKGLSTVLVGVTIFATWFAAINVTANPGMLVERGFVVLIPYFLAGPLCLFFVGRFFAKKLYEMNLVTISDFFSIRYNKRVELVISILLVFTYFHWIASQFVSLGVLFNEAIGLDVSKGVLLGAAIVVIYTYVGGMWAVSWTDMLQSALIVFGLIVLCVSILIETGGVAPLFADKPEGFYNLFPTDGLPGWSEFIGVFLAFAVGAIPAQEIYQRAFSAKSSESARRGVYLSVWLFVIISAIPAIVGLGAAYLHPELMGSEYGQNLIPSMVAQYSSMPLQVLFYGALISAILSTSSGAMLAPATLIGENILKPYLPDLFDKQLLRLTRFSVLIVAGISYYFASSDESIAGLVVASLSILLVCIVAPFVFGFFWKAASVFGAWCAITLGGVTWLYCYIMGTALDSTIYGFAVSCLAMIIGSLLKPDVSQDVHFE